MRILDAFTAMTAELVLDAIEQAIWTRQQQGHDQFDNLVAHNDRGVQYLSVAYSQRLADAGITPSVGAHRVAELVGNRLLVDPL